MKWMNFAAKVAVLTAFALMVIIFKYITMTQFMRIDEVVLIKYGSSAAFYSTTESVIYNEGQIVDIQILGADFAGVMVIGIEDTGLVVGNKNVILYEIDLNEVDNGTEATIYTKYGSFMEYILDKLVDN